MRNLWLLAPVTILLHSPTVAQSVPEGVHSDVSGPSEVCGIVGDDALAVRNKLRSDRTILEKPSGSSRFETYFSTVEAKQWTVTTEKEPAYPAVTCVRIFNSGGGTNMERNMRCDASREACDALFLEFEAHDEVIRKRIKGR